MENNNDKSKTEKFTHVSKSPKQELNRSGSDAYSEARTPQYVFKDEEERGGNKNLVVLSVVLAVLLVIVVAAAILIIGATKRETPQEAPPVKIEESLEEEETEEETDKTGNYSIVFYGESIIEKNGYVIIDADLFDEEMNKVANRKIKISPETRIISGGESITQKSLVYLIETVVDEKIVFEGTIQEKDGLALKLYFEYEAEPMPEPEEEIPEEEAQQQPTVEEPVVEPTPEIPAENQGVSVE